MRRASPTSSPTRLRFIAADLFRRPVFSPRAEAGREPDRFATADGLWTDALTRGSRTPSFRLVRAGTTLPPGAYCRTAGVGHRTIDDVIQPNRVLELYADGATMVLQGLQLTDPVLGRVANNLALALDHPVQINAYLSPAAARGLELHFDFHDVFVLQLDGRKRWRVWEPLPRTRDPVRSGAKIPLPDARRARRAGARSHPHERRLPLPAARVPARRRDHRRGVVAPDDRCARDHLAARHAPCRRRGRRGRGAHGLDPGREPRRDTTRSRPIRRGSGVISIRRACGRGWPRRSGIASRRLGCGRWCRPRSGSTRPSTSRPARCCG